MILWVTENSTAMTKLIPNSIPFRLQAGYVVGVEENQLSHKNIDSLFKDIFGHTLEYCILTYNGIPFLLHYTEDISCYVESLGDMLNDISHQNNDRKTYLFSSKSCEFSVSFSITNNELTIYGDFKKVRGGLEKALNTVPRIQMDRMNFLNEWKLLLEQVLEGFDQSKRVLKDRKGKATLETIRQINDRIERPYRYQYQLRTC